MSELDGRYRAFIKLVIIETLQKETEQHDDDRVTTSFKLGDLVPGGASVEVVKNYVRTGLSFLKPKFEKDGGQETVRFETSKTALEKIALIATPQDQHDAREFALSATNDALFEIWEFFRRWYRLLDTFFEGDRILMTDWVCFQYEALAEAIEKRIDALPVLPETRELKEQFMRPFPSMRGIHPEQALQVYREDWRPAASDLLGKLDQLVVRAGSSEHIDPATHKYLANFWKGLACYEARKKQALDAFQHENTAPSAGKEPEKNQDAHSDSRDVALCRPDNTPDKKDAGDKNPGKKPSVLISWKGLHFDCLTGAATYETTEALFTPDTGEYKLLRALLEKQGERLDYPTINELLWPEDKKGVYGGARNVSYYVRRIREKLDMGEKRKNVDLIQGRGVNGYRLK